MAERGSQTEAITHLGIIVDDLKSAAAEWEERYGMKVVDELDVEVEGVRSLFLSPGYKRDEGFCIELVEPKDKSDMGNAVAKRLADSGEGVFHIALRMDDAMAAEPRLRELGATVYAAPSAGLGEPGRTLVHPKSANGVLLELF